MAIFSALKHRNYRIFFAGQAVSVTGTWLQMTAMPWLVYRLTNSSVYLGLIGFISQFIIMALSPFAGAVADHYNKKKMLQLTQSLAMFLALALGVLALKGHIKIWHILVATVIAGVINALDLPTRQSFVVEMVGREDLMNAIALNSSLFNGARFIAPAIAGIIIASFGEGMCFLINSVTFLAVLVSFYMMKNLHSFHIGAEKNADIGEKFKTGIKYIKETKKIYYMLLMIAVTSLFNVFPMTLMPVFVKDIFNLDAAGFGSFMSITGVGAVIGTMRVASMKNHHKLSMTIISATAFYGACMVLFSIIKNITVAIFLLPFFGYFMVMQIAVGNTYIQMNVPDDKRGRVMGFFTMALIGLGPFGCLLAGFISDSFSAPVAMITGGIGCILVALFYGKKVLENDV